MEDVRIGAAGMKKSGGTQKHRHDGARAEPYPLSKRIGLALFFLAAVIVLVPLARYALLKRAQRHMNICYENRTRIEGAIFQWAFEKGIPPGSILSESDLSNLARAYPPARDYPLFYEFDIYGEKGPESPPPVFLPVIPVCPSGAKYRIGAVGESPVCTSGLPGHDMQHRGC